MSDSDAHSRTTFCYRLLTLKGAQVAPRVMEAFAKRDLLPLRFDCRAGAERLTIEVEVVLDAPTAHHIGRCLANIVEIERVALAAAAETLRATA